MISAASISRLVLLLFPSAEDCNSTSFGALLKASQLLLRASSTVLGCSVSAFKIPCHKDGLAVIVALHLGSLSKSRKLALGSQNGLYCCFVSPCFSFPSFKPAS